MNLHTDFSEPVYLW